MKLMITNELSKWRARQGRGGISKAQLARRVGVNHSHITRLEQGKTQPSAELMFRFAQYFGCDIEDIFHYGPKGKRRLKKNFP